jgi:hypothetical protein
MQADIKLLDKVIGDKKELYLGILQCLANGFTEEETGYVFNLTKGRISQIYKANKQLCDELTLNADLSKQAGRLRFAFRNVRRKDGRSLKDQLDWLEYIRKEMVGEKGIDVKVGIGVNVNGNSNGAIDKDLQHRLREHFGIPRTGIQEEQPK